MTATVVVALIFDGLGLAICTASVASRRRERRRRVAELARIVAEHHARGAGRFR